jgi:hypothetical protein
MRNEVRYTNDYDVFKVLPGNRDYEKHGERLIPSVGLLGVITPIIVNEKMEVIDGQGRLYAAKANGVKVPFIIKKNLGIDACIEMNNTQTGWGYRDYIKSYASIGNEDYMELQSYIEKYPKLPIYCVWFGLSGGKYSHEKQIKAGEYKSYPKDRKKIIDALAFMQSVAENEKIFFHIPGRKHLFFKAMFYAVGLSKTNKSRLVSALERYITNDDVFHPFNNEENAIRSLEKAYNYNLKTDSKINLIGFYRDAKQRGLTWFGKSKDV